MQRRHRQHTAVEAIARPTPRPPGPRADGLPDAAARRFDATREIRRRESPGAARAIIALTANALSGDRAACLAPAWDDFLRAARARRARRCVECWAGLGAARTDRCGAAAAAASPTLAAEAPVDFDALDALTDGMADFHAS